MDPFANVNAMCDKYAIIPVTRALFPERYRLDALLGTGMDGAAHQATFLPNNEAVVVKMLRKSVLVTPENVPHDGNRLTRMASETFIHAHVRHLNVAKFYKALHDEENVCIVMEYCPGGTLQSFLEAHEHIRLVKLLSLLKQRFQVPTCTNPASPTGTSSKVTLP